MRRNPVLAGLAVATAASASMLALAAPAAAYPPGNTSQASLSTTTVGDGGTLTAQGGGFDSSEPVDTSAHSKSVFLGSTRANARGVATITVTIPRSFPAGVHTLRMVGERSGHVDTATFTVVGGSPSRASSGSGLPFTGGNDIWQMTAAGVGLIVVGGAAVTVVRRRRHSGLAA